MLLLLELDFIGLNKIAASTAEWVKALDVHASLYKVLDVRSRFMRTQPFFSFVR